MRTAMKRMLERVAGKRTKASARAICEARHLMRVVEEIEGLTAELERGYEDLRAELEANGMSSDTIALLHR